MAAENTTDPKLIYQQSVDKQRVVVVGTQSAFITRLLLHILNFFNRDFDFASGAAPLFFSDKTRITGAPVIILEGTPVNPALPEYHHHIIILSDLKPEDEAEAARLANATPKGGTVVYSDKDIAARIGKAGHPDVTAIPYTVFPHVVEGGKVILVSSTGERVPVLVSGEQNLRSVSAAKEVLKKLGITSSQFYRAVATFEA